MSVGSTKYPFEPSAPPPAMIVAFFFASSRYSLIFVNDFRSMTAPMKLRKSRTSPTRMSLIMATAASRTAGHNDLGTYARLAAEHFWPWYSNAPRTKATARLCGSADGCAMMKSFPPVSPTMRGYVR